VVARVHRVLTFVGSSDEDEARERDLVEAFAARGPSEQHRSDHRDSVPPAD
jgi:hypothetical protein